MTKCWQCYFNGRGDGVMILDEHPHNPAGDEHWKCIICQTEYNVFNTEFTFSFEYDDDIEERT